MATILKFRREELVGKNRQPTSPGDARGEIVIFPGVRIERHRDEHEIGHSLRIRRHARADRPAE